MEKKLTKKDKFTMALEMAREQENELLVDFFENELSLLENKYMNNNSKNSAKIAEMLDVMYNNVAKYEYGATATELLLNGEYTDDFKNKEGNITVQKITSYLTKLVEAKRIVSAKRDGKTHFLVPKQN